MKYIILALTVCAACFLTGCETLVGPDGQTRTVMSPVGSALTQVLVSTATGAGTGALMKNSPSWATGAVSGASGNITSQLVNAFLPTKQNIYNAQAQPVNYPVRQQQQSYQPNYQQASYQRQQQNYQPNYQQQQQNYPQYAGVNNARPVDQQPLFTQLPNGKFVRVQ